MTLEISHGSSSAPRRTIDLVRRCMSTASTIAMTVWKPMLRMTYQMVTAIAFQNSGSTAIFSKLSVPIQVGDPRMLYCVKLK